VPVGEVSLCADEDFYFAAAHGGGACRGGVVLPASDSGVTEHFADEGLFEFGWGAAVGCVMGGFVEEVCCLRVRNFYAF